VLHRIAEKKSDFKPNPTAASKAAVCETARLWSPKARVTTAFCPLERNIQSLCQFTVVGGSLKSAEPLANLGVRRHQLP
jgi:hypothetical protein